MSLTTTAPQLRAESLTIGYEQRIISENLNVRIPEGLFTVIVGPNACGKSTLLRALARLIKPRSGQVLLDGKSVHAVPARELAAGTRTRSSSGSGLLPTKPLWSRPWKQRVLRRCPGDSWMSFRVASGRGFGLPWSSRSRPL